MTWRNFIETENTLGKFVSFLTVIFSFFVISYWSNLLRTDLVVTPEPDTVNSFKDIIDKRLWVTTLPEGIRGTYNGKTFYEAVKDRKFVGTEVGLTDMMQLMTKVLSSNDDKVVWLAPSFSLGMLLSFTCQQWQNKDGLSDDKRLMYLWASWDKENARR